MDIQYCLYDENKVFIVQNCHIQTNRPSLLYLSIGILFFVLFRRFKRFYVNKNVDGWIDRIIAFFKVFIKHFMCCIV